AAKETVHPEKGHAENFFSLISCGIPLLQAFKPAAKVVEQFVLEVDGNQLALVWVRPHQSVISGFVKSGKSQASLLSPSRISGIRFFSLCISACNGLDLI